MTPAQAQQFERIRALGPKSVAEAHAGRLEDYLFVTGGDPYRMSARQAADRLGVTPRTVQRWRAWLRHPPQPITFTPALDADGNLPYADRREYLDSFGGAA